MNILALTKRSSGCGFHRIVMPLTFMDNIKAIITDKVTEEVTSNKYDILFFNRLNFYYDNNLDEARKIYNCKVVMDLDDDWELPPSHLLHYDYETIKHIIVGNLEQADMVTCTNQRLADKIYKHNKNVIVIPNALPYGQHQFITDKVEDECTRIFWSGSITHEHDLAILRNPFNRLLSDNNKIKMVIAGISTKTAVDRFIWQRMINNFTLNRKLPHILLEGLLPESYMQLYEYGDIAVIPLEKTYWHASKSNLKVLECACKKLPVIVSKVEPYSLDSEAPVLWVERKTDWYKHIKYLLQNKNARIDYGEKLYEWAKDKYELTNINEFRRTTFTNLISA